MGERAGISRVMPRGGAALEGAGWGAWGLFLSGENSAGRTAGKGLKAHSGGSLSPAAGFLVSAPAGWVCAGFCLHRASSSLLQAPFPCFP